MGLSTVQQLIQRAKNMNEYNNSGVSKDDIWVDFFNEALMSMVEYLNIDEEVKFTLNSTTTTFDLPEGYYGLIKITDSSTNELRPYKDEGFTLDGGRGYSPGYNIKNKGSKYIIEFPLMQPDTFTVSYIRYPLKLENSTIQTQKPEVPTVGETALCYKAISHALENNNQPGQARYFDEKYVLELDKINKASYRARGQ